MAVVKFIHNATLLYTSKSGYRILCDPWFTPGAFLTWTHVYDVGPPPRFPNDFDAIYVSHAHEDHYDETYLSSLPRSIPIILPEERLIPILKKKLDRLGFRNLLVSEEGIPNKLGDVTFIVYGPYQRSRFGDEGQFPNILDSSIFFDDSDSTFLNTNDNFPTKSALDEFTTRFGKINCIGILYNSAGFYPHCVMNLQEREKIEESGRVVKKCLDLVSDLKLGDHCDYILPMAGDFRLEGSSTGANRFLPLSSPSEFRDQIQNVQKIGVVCPGGLGKFDVKSGRVLEDGISYQSRDIREHFVERPTERCIKVFDQIKQFDTLDSSVLIDKFNHRLKNLNARLPYNFDVIDLNSKERLFTYKNGSEDRVDIHIEKNIFLGLVNRQLHWQNAWLGGLMGFWRSDHPRYNKDFYDLLSFLHY